MAASCLALTDTESRYAHIEKEALAITWACKRFSNYILGKHISIENRPQAISPRQFATRFRLRMMKFDYTIQHVPGKFLYTVDALSRAPIRGTPTLDEIASQQEVVFIDSLILRSHEHAYLVWLGSARIGSKRRTVHTSYGSLIRPGNLSASYETLN